MNKINYFSILAYTALYVVTVFATAFLGYLSPFAWVFFPVIAALLGSFSYYFLAKIWKLFGVSTLLSFLLAVFLLITGECDAPNASLILLAGVAADMIRLFFEQNAQKAMFLAYPIQKRFCRRTALRRRDVRLCDGHRDSLFLAESAQLC